MCNLAADLQWHQIRLKNECAARYDHTACSVSDRIYLVGGRDDRGTIFNEILIFNTST